MDTCFLRLRFFGLERMVSTISEIHNGGLLISVVEAEGVALMQLGYVLTVGHQI